MNPDDIKVADALLADVHDLLNKFGDYVVFKIPGLAMDATGMEYSDIKYILNRAAEALEVPEKKYGDFKPGLAKVAILRGRIYGLRSKYAEAVQQYEYAIELNPDGEVICTAHYYRGITCEVFGRIDEAVESFDIVTTIAGVDSSIGMDSAKRVEKLRSGGNKKGMCFIATAAAGRSSASEVIILQRFRDEHLSKSRFGMAFVECYTRVSPPIARLIDKSKLLRLVVMKTLIKPMSAIASLMLAKRDYT